MPHRFDGSFPSLGPAIGASAAAPVRDRRAGAGQANRASVMTTDLQQ